MGKEQIKYDILMYSHCGQSYKHFYCLANNKNHAKQVFEAFSYPSDSIEEINEFLSEEPHFMTMEEAIKKGKQWEEMRQKRRGANH